MHGKTPDSRVQSVTVQVPKPLRSLQSAPPPGVLPLYGNGSTMEVDPKVKLNP